MEAVRGLLQDLPPENIFNMDETGLFYRCLPNRSFVPVEQRRAARGTKSMKAKERVTLVLACNATGSRKVPVCKDSPLKDTFGDPKNLRSGRLLTSPHELNRGLNRPRVITGTPAGVCNHPLVSATPLTHRPTGESTSRPAYVRVCRFCISCKTPRLECFGATHCVSSPFDLI